MSDTPRHDGDPSDDAGRSDLAGLTGLYALDALDDDVRSQFEAFLATSPEARAEVAEFRATAGLLTATVEHEPPPSLRERVLAEVADHRQDAPVVDLRTRRRSVSRSTWLAVAAVAVVLAGVIGGLVGNRSSTTGPATNEVADFIARPDAKVVPLSGGAAAGAKVIWSESAGQAMIVTNGAVKLTDDQTYELWRLDGTTATPVGLFRPDGSGNVRTTIPADLSGADALGVTVEPSGGSATPTLPVVLSGPIPA